MWESAEITGNVRVTPCNVGPNATLNKSSRHAGAVSSIEIVEYRAGWIDEFRGVGEALRRALGDAAIRINHIGSTAVPGLAAKDIVDVQVTVASLPLPDRIVSAFDASGFPLRDDI